MINPYQSRAALFGQMQARQAAQTAPAAAQLPPAQIDRAAASAAVAPAEQQRIQRAFPDQPALSMKLYGRTDAQTIAPGSLGSRLDLRG
jgi:hypothetical protein